MKNFPYLLGLLLLGACQNESVVPPGPAEFASLAEAKAFFYSLDDQHNRAQVAHDSAFFIRHYATTFLNTTPFGIINTKAAEIQVQLHMPWVSVARIAPQFDVFTYGGQTATLMVVKHTQLRTPTGLADTYPRRTIVYQKINGQWQAVSGQVTYLLPATVEQ